MKKCSAFFLVLFLLFVLASCAIPADSDPASATQVTDEPTTQAEEKPAVITIEQQNVKYACEECAGECTYYTGKFRCPSIDRGSEDARAVNEAIKADYDKYVALAKEISVSGLAYGFDFDTYCKDGDFVILRTAIETVFLHSGGTYSYDFYYYDLANDCNADIGVVCSCFGLDINVIAAYLQLELSLSGEYDEEQIAGITADCIDIFPAGEDAYFIRVQNDRLKYETTLGSSDLNARGEEIASLLQEAANVTEPVTDENGEIVSEDSTEPEATTQQDVIYMEY